MLASQQSNIKYYSFLIVGILALLIARHSCGHGIISSTANITERGNGLVELKIQFDLVTFLQNSQSPKTLQQLSTLEPEHFSNIYKDVIHEFKKGLNVTQGKKAIALNQRFPSSEDVHALLKREFIESKLSKQAKKSIPYTFNERRFYQVFFMDFKIKKGSDLQSLSIQFPKALRNMYVTYSKSHTSELHTGETWRQISRY